ncbi:hypothetical protein ACS126_17940 [Sphingobacterium lactis]|uniref:hypothetical protein n=1 Tax=Sphingobacterium lactis TaxID=797291 RepID=UPI003EC8C561
MQPTIDRILQAINECKDPIKNTVARNKRDAILDEIGMQLLDKSRIEVESYAKDDDQLQALSWFYTRFVHFKVSNRPIKKME